MTAVLAPLLAKLFFVLAAGTLLRSRLPSRTRTVIYRFILDAAMPVLMLLVLSRIEVDPAVLVAALPVSLAQLVTAGLALALALAFRLPHPTQGSAAMTTTFANTGFLGFPVVVALWNADATASATAIAVDTVCTTVWLWSFGVLMASHFGSHRAFSWRGLARTLVRPHIICVALGLALSIAGIRPPASLHGFTSGLSLVVSVLVFFALGLSLDLGALRGRVVPMAAMTGLKLLAQPLIVLGLARGLDLPETVTVVAVLQGAMPSAMTSVVISAHEGCDETFAAGVAALSTLLCVATLPAIAWLVERSAG